MCELLAFFNKGESKELKMKQCIFCQPAALLLFNQPPPLTVLDTLNQGGHADPISWCRTLPKGVQTTPRPYSIYLLVPCASVWPPSNALG